MLKALAQAPLKKPLDEKRQLGLWVRAAHWPGQGGSLSMGHFSIGFHSPHQCLPRLAQTVNIDDCSLANYVWLIFTKCITDSLDRSPCEPSSRKFFRRQTSNMKGTHAFCSAENSDGSAFRPQFPGSLGPYSVKIKRGQ